MTTETIFLKLGGSLLTDKTKSEAVRLDVVKRMAAEIADALDKKPQIRLLLGHGSGSYGHVAAAKHGTRLKVNSREQWVGFAEVSSAAARLNAIVREELLAAGIPAITFQPSASARCEDGVIQHMDIHSIEMASNSGLLPIVYGDVAFDDVRGGTIISTEEILGFLAPVFEPKYFLLAGETDGVLDAYGNTIPIIDRNNFIQISSQLGQSRGTDVTGGMSSKVYQMLALVGQVSGLRARIFSGLAANQVRDNLLGKAERTGTTIQ